MKPGDPIYWQDKGIIYAGTILNVLGNLAGEDTYYKVRIFHQEIYVDEKHTIWTQNSL